MTDFGHGTPVWADLGTPDVADAVRFYGLLFGWTAAQVPGGNGYALFSLGDEPVAGVGPVRGLDDQNEWCTYLLTDDADESARRVAAAGGTVEKPPYDVLTLGRTAAFLDPAGAEFSVWQPGDLPGAAVFNAPGALTWNELSTPDAEGAQRFYGDVFGWTANPGDYRTWQSAGRQIGGLVPIDAPAPARWMVYFGVADCDASTERAIRLGATVAVQPTDIPWGRFATLNDPQGAFFSIFQG
ncbi:VOC family protein [Catenuloplanes atrovinosus]|uniref:Enzyme related to lactoylglutathione lyase n=1 Tax=Catenuloplanes atrovinosus TaxID=137266 RepID=A0AAE4CCK7_9ACTN|nr:VOC family protein [Catenuloplanes atrovinosus]MDR7279731.1 putative enzyme related to lactoylglutathione lyase [Catenuloplanes atrovinosus]